MLGPGIAFEVYPRDGLAGGRSRKRGTADALQCLHETPAPEQPPGHWRALLAQLRQVLARGARRPFRLRPHSISHLLSSLPFWFLPSASHARPLTAPS